MRWCSPGHDRFALELCVSTFHSTGARAHANHQLELAMMGPGPRGALAGSRAPAPAAASALLLGFAGYMSPMILISNTPRGVNKHQQSCLLASGGALERYCVK